MTNEEFLALALALPGAVADCPFARDEATVLRHRGNRRWFGLVWAVNGHPSATLKCEPDKAVGWRALYPEVIPAYHMNKQHWNTVYLDGGVTPADLAEMLQDSYALTKGAARKAAPPHRKGERHGKF